MSDPILFHKLKYLVQCARDQGATADELHDFIAKLTTEPDYLQSELDCTTWDEDKKEILA